MLLFLQISVIIRLKYPTAVHLVRHFNGVQQFMHERHLFNAGSDLLPQGFRHRHCPVQSPEIFHFAGMRSSVFILPSICNIFIDPSIDIFHCLKFWQRCCRLHFCLKQGHVHICFLLIYNILRKPPSFSINSTDFPFPSASIYDTINSGRKPLT